MSRSTADESTLIAEGNALIWLLVAVFSVMVFLTLISEPLFATPSCLTVEQAMYGSVLEYQAGRDAPHCK